MPEDPIVQVRYGEFRLVPAPEEAPPPKRGLNLKRISEAAARLWTITLRTVLLGSVFGILIVTASEVVRETVVVEEIGLPKPLLEMGYSGSVAAHRLWDSTKWINDNAGTTKDRASLVTASRQLEITEPGTGLSLSGLVQVVRRLLGREETRIGGEFVCRDKDCSIDEMELRIRTFQNGAMTVSGVGPFGAIATEANLDAYFDRAGMTLLAMIDPYVRASFLSSFEKNELPAQEVKRAKALVASLEPPPLETSDRRSLLEAKALLRRRHPQRSWAAVMLAVESERLDAKLEWARRSISFMRIDRVDPFPNGYDSLGVALSGFKRHEEAIEMYRAALKIDPDYANSYNNWGVSLNDLGNPKEAIEKFRTAVEIDPDNASAHHNWGISLGKLGRYEEAIEKYRVAIEIDPNSVDSYNNWGINLSIFGRHEEAIEKYRAALEIDPSYVRAYFNWAFSLGRLERHVQSIEKYRVALEINPEYSAAYNGWGNRLSDLGRNEEAIEKYRAALEIDPNYAFAYDNLVRLADRLLETTDAYRCGRFIFALTALGEFATKIERVNAFTERSKGVRLACPSPRVAEIAAIESIKIEPSTFFPIKITASITQNGEWIKIASDLQEVMKFILKTNSQHELVSLHLFDSNHNLIADNLRNLYDTNFPEPKLEINLGQGPYLLRIQALTHNENPVSFSIDTAE